MLAPSPIQLSADHIAAVFTAAQTQEDYILGLFRLVHPDFDQIKGFSGAPVCSPDTWKRICQLAQDVDGRLNKTRDYDKQILPGGAWMNYGFSARGGEELPLWAVLPVDEAQLRR